MANQSTRAVLLDSAAKLAAEGGMTAVTLSAVSARSGVTKGALFHYFASRAELVVAMASDMLQRLDADVDRHLASDTRVNGRFTRAYVNMVFDDIALTPQTEWAAIIAAVWGDDAIRTMWHEWVAARAKQHAGTDGSTVQAMIRLAADGIWFSRTGFSSEELDDMRENLIAISERTIDRNPVELGQIDTPRRLASRPSAPSAGQSIVPPRAVGRSRLHPAPNVRTAGPVGH